MFIDHETVKNDSARIDNRELSRSRYGIFPMLVPVNYWQLCSDNLLLILKHGEPIWAKDYEKNNTPSNSIVFE